MSYRHEIKCSVVCRKLAPSGFGPRAWALRERFKALQEPQCLCGKSANRSDWSGLDSSGVTWYQPAATWNDTGEGHYLGTGLIMSVEIPTRGFCLMTVFATGNYLVSPGVMPAQIAQKAIFTLFGLRACFLSPSFRSISIRYFTLQPLLYQRC